ncbi:MAG: DEAD/DEAH box helicase [Deltaproteobacteria bacterium]|nr:DEAD/DEAH box helicase [Deltaproteobacteria bacterium]
MTTAAVRRSDSPGDKKVSRTHRPDHLSLEQWQAALRRQFGREQKFKWRNLGDGRILSEYSVTNPATKRTYRVIVRGTDAGENHCSCPDFAVNTLGTCKHIEFVLGRLERRQGGKNALAAGHRPPYSELILRYGTQRKVVFRPGAECPAALVRLAAEFFGEDGALRDDKYSHFDRFLTGASGNGHEVRCRDDAVAFVAEVRDAERRRRQLERRFPAGAESESLDGLLKATLHPYQKEGALFAARAGRCLIGDEMGLGKTVQAIAASEILAREFGIEKVLVICPTSLKHQWKQEIEKFSDRPALVVEGPLHVRASMYRTPGFYKIVNYDVIHRDLDAINAWQPDVIVLDEAQRIKNWKTRAAQAVKRLKSPHAFVLTGTPLENRLEELYSIVQFIDQFRLGPMFRFLANHQQTDEFGKVVGYQDLGTIGKTLSSILVRRKKDEVALQLPARIDNQFFVPMTEQQMSIHEENQEIVARIVAKWRRYKFLSEADQRRLTCALQNMRMSCDSTYLVDHETDHGAKADELVNLLDEVFEDPDAKVVVFSQWLRMHEVICKRIEQKGWNHVLFHGGVPSKQRGGLVKQFRDDPSCRLFLATDAGGTGLNLQNASVVVNMDIPWNPAVLEQRIGRVHRLGQEKPVQAVSFVAQGTIEHGMLSLLSFKKSMFEGVLDGGPGDVFMGGSRLTKFMETVEKATGTIPPAMPPEAPGDKEESREEKPLPEDTPSAPAPSAPPTNPWLDALNAGMMLLQNLNNAMTQGGSGGSPKPLVHRDEKTGETFLRVPNLDPAAAGKLAQGLSLLAEALGGAQGGKA